MVIEPAASNQLPSQSRRPSPWKRLAVIACVFVLVYLVVTYLVVPWVWKLYARHHPSFDDNPRITETGDGHPGDPLNVGLIGAESEVKKIMQAARWYVADPLGMKSDLKIGVATVLDRSYDAAPVSNLFLFGRKEDLAFEQPVGDNPRHRHHVRLWRTAEVDERGRAIWVGSASYDKRVGFSHTTGQITHHIAPDVDAEREYLLATIEQTGGLTEIYKVSAFHKTLNGRNGGGDAWHTDGDLWVGVIAAGQ